MLALAAAVLGFAAPVAADCLSLGSSSMCPHFQTSYIDPTKLAKDAPGTGSWGADWSWLSSVSSATEFDTAFKNYLEASDNSGFRYQMQDALNCWSGKAGNWGASSVSSDNKTGPVFQYQQTALCSIMVGSSSSLDCGKQMQGNVNTQQPACSDVCDAFYNSMQEVMKDSYWCGGGRKSAADTYQKLCNQASQESTATCVQGNVNEDYCGFGSNWKTGLCDYCSGSGSKDSCCTTQNVQTQCGDSSSSSSGSSTSPSGSATAGAGAVNRPSGSKKGLSGGAIAGIVVGVIVGVLLLAAILGWLFWRRKKNSAKSKSLAAAPYEKFGESPPQGARPSPPVSPTPLAQSSNLPAGESHTGRNAALGAAAGAGAGAAALAAANRSSAKNERPTSPPVASTIPATTTAANVAPSAAAAAPATVAAEGGPPHLARAGPAAGAEGAPHIAQAGPVSGTGPSTGIGAPSTGTGAPSTGIGAPSAGVSAPSTNFGAPSTGIGEPSSGMGRGATAAAIGIPAAAVGAAGAAAASSSRPLPTSPTRQAASPPPPPRPVGSTPSSPTSPISASSRPTSPPGTISAGAFAANSSPFSSPSKPRSPPPDRNQFYAPSSPTKPGRFSTSTPVGAVHSGPGYTATPLNAAAAGAGMAGVGAGAMAAARSQPGSTATTPNGSTVALPALNAPTAALATAPPPSDATASNANRQQQILDATGAYITPGSMVTVMHPYAAQMPDELTLAPGMRLRVVDLFDDGWGTAVEVSREGSQGRRGQFPTVCVQASS